MINHMRMEFLKSETAYNLFKKMSVFIDRLINPLLLSVDSVGRNQ